MRTGIDPAGHFHAGGHRGDVVVEGTRVRNGRWAVRVEHRHDLGPPAESPEREPGPDVFDEGGQVWTDPVEVSETVGTVA